jgi:hypothetical protein
MASFSWICSAFYVVCCICLPTEYLDTKKGWGQTNQVHLIGYSVKPVVGHLWDQEKVAL